MPNPMVRREIRVHELAKHGKFNGITISSAVNVDS